MGQVVGPDGILGRLADCVHGCRKHPRPVHFNTLKDHKTPLEQKGSELRGQALIQIYTTYNWIASVCDTCLWVMFEVQYIVPALLTDLLLTSAMSRRYFRHPEGMLADC